jgi:histidyl-tRNA synthetase
MRDFLPREVRQRQHLITNFRQVYERYGFEPIDTPALERLEVLLGKGGDENEKLIFKVMKRGASLERSLQAQDELADAGLRFDLTVPLARYYVEYQSKLPRVFRRYHIGPVWRADRPARGRFREFYQCDVDIVGAASSAAEVEVILATADALEVVGFSGFSVKLNDRRLLGALLEAVGIPSSLEGSAVIALDKMDKMGMDGVAKELAERGITADVIERLRGFVAAGIAELAVQDGLASFEKELQKLGVEKPPLDDLRQISADIAVARGDKLRLTVDPLLARGMGYYTGPIFEIASREVPFSLGGGGRYDELLARFGKQSIPAVGFSIGFERILSIMTEREMFPVELGGIDVYVTVFSAEHRAAALQIAEQLRSAGFDVLTSVLLGSLKPQLREADERGARFAIIEGPSEREQGVLQVKDMKSAQAQLVAKELIVDWLFERRVSA